MGLKEALVVENHHNFAWEEKLPDGRKVIVHRKGATPAGAGVLGVIPGSMGDAGYVVRGRGVSASLESASHGAGRLMSRKAALNSISKASRGDYLLERGVTLLGGGGMNPASLQTDRFDHRRPERSCGNDRKIHAAHCAYGRRSGRVLIKEPCEPPCVAAFARFLHW